METLCAEALDEALEVGDETDNFDEVNEPALDLLHAQAMAGMLDGEMNRIVLSVWDEWEGDAWELYEMAKRRAGFGRLPHFFSDD